MDRYPLSFDYEGQKQIVLHFFGAQAPTYNNEYNCTSSQVKEYTHLI